MEIQMGRWILAVILLETAALAFFLWLMYVVTKNAIRDGIKESGLVQEIRRNRNTDNDELREPSFTRER